MRRIALFGGFILIFIRLSAQVDTLSTQSVKPDSVNFDPELQFSGDDFIPGRDSTNNAALLDSPQNLSDSTRTSAKNKPRKNDIETTINYSARDSMVFDITGKKLYLFGQTHIDYGPTTLESNRTSIDWTQRTIRSEYTLDSTGRKQGKPVFSQGSDQYETDNITYNFKTKRAVIKGVVTEQDGAIMHGENVKKNEENELFIRDAKYTTCNLADPHFFVKAEKIKVIPGNKVLTGPFILKFREIPTPLAFLLGMFPQPRKKASGIVFPSYGEETQRGFFLRDGGYYFGFSEYFDLRLTGSVYSKGGYALDATTNYKVRYKFNGALNFSYTKNITEAETTQTSNESFWVRWSLRPESRGNASFSVNVNAGSTNFNSQNNLALTDPNRSINSRFTSSVSYNQKFRRLPFNMSANLRQSQNVSTGIYQMSLPDFSLNMNRIYPFKNMVKSSKSPLAKISFSHNFVAKNEITNAPASTSGLGFTPINSYNVDDDEPLKFTPENFQQIYDQAKIGGRHSIPISTSFNLLKYFTVNPSFNYQEVWYTRELDYTYVPEENGVRVDTIDGFSRAGSWSSGASVNTRVYGMYYIKGIKGIEAIRHVMTPSVSFSYNPDFGSEKFGVYENIQLDSTGRSRRVSKYQNFAYGSPTGSESRTVSFSLTNNIEMKVRAKKDTVNEFKKVKLFDNLSLNSGYNFAADSFKLSNLGWNARTSLFKQKVSVAVTGTYDPYVYIDNGSTNGQRIDRYAWNNGGGLGTLNRLNTAVSFNLKPKSKKGDGKREENAGDIDMNQSAFANDGSLINQNQFATDDEKEYIRQNPDQYVDFNMPWSLRVSYNVNRTRSGLSDPSITSHGLQFNGTLGLTANTQITFNSGYDIKNKDFTQTSLGVVRDLHCWTLNFNWVPFGRFQSFSLIIRPKSSILQDLKIQKRRSFQDFFAN